MDHQDLQDLEANQEDQETKVFQDNKENEVQQDLPVTLEVMDSPELMEREVHRDRLDQPVLEGLPDLLVHPEPRVSAESVALQEELDNKDDLVLRVNRDLPGLKEPRDLRVHPDKQETEEHKENVGNLDNLVRGVKMVTTDVLDNLVREVRQDPRYVI